MGGQTPCFSTLADTLTPPPLTAALASNPSTVLPTAAVVNVVYAMHYSVSPSSAPALTTGAIAGIGVGSAVAALALVGAGVLALLRRRDRRRMEELKSELQTTQASTPGGPLSSGAVGAVGTSVVPTVAPGRTPSMVSALSGSDVAGTGRHPYPAASVSPPPAVHPIVETQYDTVPYQAQQQQQPPQHYQQQYQQQHHQPAEYRPPQQAYQQPQSALYPQQQQVFPATAQGPGVMQGGHDGNVRNEMAGSSVPQTYELAHGYYDQ